MVRVAFQGREKDERYVPHVIRALVAEANRASKVNPENLEVFRADLLRTVFGLYVAEDSGSKRPEYPEQSPLQLPNQNHSVAAATMLYLGSGTNAHGEITQALFEPWAPEKLVDVKQLSGLTADREKLRDFLLWIGVAQWPRSVIKNTPEKEYLQHTLRSITFPAQFGEKVVSSQSEATSSRVSDIQSVDGLDEILSKAAPAAITAWLASDYRAWGWGRQSQGHAKLQAYPDKVRNPRVYQGSLPSYTRWRIESTPWLRSADRKELKPKDCVLGECAIEELFPRPAMPDQDTLEHYGIQQREVLEGWQRAGVLTSLAYLERDEIYAKLLELP